MAKDILNITLHFGGLAELLVNKIKKQVISLPTDHIHPGLKVD